MTRGPFIDADFNTTDDEDDEITAFIPEDGIVMTIPSSGMKAVISSSSSSVVLKSASIKGPRVMCQPPNLLARRVSTLRISLSSSRSQSSLETAVHEAAVPQEDERDVTFAVGELTISGFVVGLVKIRG